MLKGLAITPPIVGRISIGRVVEKNGKRLPEKDDQFTLTTQIQQNGEWLLHPLDSKLREQSESVKLRSIPVRLLFNDPDLNLRAEYCVFDRQTGRPYCVGNGEQCRRSSVEGVNTLPCPTPESCEIAQERGCKPYGRLHVALDDEDSLSSFVFRTTGFNSIRSLAARLRYYHAVSGGLLSCMALQLRLRGKSTTQSYRSAIYYVDLTLREGMSMTDTISEAKSLNDGRSASGYNQQALDKVASAGFSNANFEYDIEESLDVVEEFYPDKAGEISQTPESLKDKLEKKTLP